MQTKSFLTVLTTGGTIEKTYSEFDGSIKNRESLIKKKILSKLRLPHTEIEVAEIMSKDSLDMTSEDRQTILEQIVQRMAEKRPIIVLHGTDTMDQTLKHCQQHSPNPTVPVVFTGAMRPAGFDDSDATQNMTEALLAAQILPPGWYVSFHSTIHRGAHITKNKRRSTFESE